ncbi:hypothetical protein [Acinetobacter sp. ANC 5054]|uniref:hypothetical protein n=1 Tax=Acinetobacter sp. ANC 5054 TaxID=1977877 RepID=UPI00148A7230|nr:hypothetical protein [Acinetobacter sp. ANC 5054]
MKKLEIGQKVKLALMENSVFIITEIHVDNSYTVESTNDGGQKISYDNVSFEMLKVLND